MPVKKPARLALLLFSDPAPPVAPAQMCCIQKSALDGTGKPFTFSRTSMS